MLDLSVPWNYGLSISPHSSNVDNKESDYFTFFLCDGSIMNPKNMELISYC